MAGQGALGFVAIADALIAAVGQLGTSLAALAKGVRAARADWQGLDDDEARRRDRAQQKQLLERLHRQLFALDSAQRAVLVGWPRFKAAPSEGEWVELRRSFGALAIRVREVRSVLATYRGDLRLHRPDLFAGFEDTTRRRGQSIDRILLLPRPRSRAEINKLNTLRDAYGGLAGRLRELIAALSAYYDARYPA